MDRYDKDLVKQYASGRWGETLSTLAGIDRDLMDPKRHFPCPKCGGTDRFRVFDDFEETGGCLCNKCGKFANGFDTLMWMKGLKFYDAVVAVAVHIGVKPDNHKQNGKASHKPAADPAEHLEFHPWNELSASYWCQKKPPIIPAAILTCGGRLAKYRKRFHVVALPIWGEKLTASGPIGWTLYNRCQPTLPSFSWNKAANKWDVTEEKILTTYGSKSGLIGPVDQLAAATHVWKLEGPSDLLSFYSLAGIPPGVVAVTNSSGAGEKPQPWMIELLAGKTVYVLHDADDPGQSGALGKTDARGTHRHGWLECVSALASETNHVRLPYDVVPDHGKDLRDFLNEQEQCHACKSAG